MLKLSLYTLGISGIVVGLLLSEIPSDQTYATLFRGQDEAANIRLLRLSFLRVKKTEWLTICGLNLQGYETCVESEGVESSGSSVLISSTRNHSYILTAGHVCDPQPASNMDLFLNVEQQKEVLLRIANMVSIRTMERNIRYEATNVFGRQANNLEIVQSDNITNVNDLCLMRSDFINGVPAVRIAERVPGIGEEIINIAAPYDIFDFNMVPILTGIWCGSNPSYQAFICDLPASPGSSGSPVFNQEGELVSIIHSTHVQFHASSFGANLAQIRNIVEEHIE
jgi:S1-C subfamily serine protease